MTCASAGRVADRVMIEHDHIDGEALRFFDGGDRRRAAIDRDHYSFRRRAPSDCIAASDGP